MIRSMSASLWIVIVALAITPFITSSAVADDFDPAWFRGYPMTTLYAWDFDLDPPQDQFTQLPPDGSVGPVLGDGGSGPPFAMAMFGMTWVDRDPSGPGGEGWEADPFSGGSMVIYAPNWIDTRPWKDVWIQLTYEGVDPTDRPDVSSFSGYDSGTASAITGQSFVDEYYSPNDGYLRQTWRILPNPDWEQFTIGLPAGMFLDQVVVDAMSGIPEPSTVILMGLGGLGLLGFARRRRMRAR